MRTLMVVALLALLGDSSSAARQQNGSRVIEVTAERFEFWPPKIAIEEGEDVELRVRSEDTVHGFRILGTSTSLVVPKRGKGHVAAKLTGLAPGSYTFECSRMCGAGHHFMRGVLVVRPSSAGDTR